MNIQNLFPPFFVAFNSKFLSLPCHLPLFKLKKNILFENLFFFFFNGKFLGERSRGTEYIGYSITLFGTGGLHGVMKVNNGYAWACVCREVCLLMVDGLDLLLP
jgi:hypothetical protein